jgi:1,2-phenylacetyl-CoA epoxidase PaaB subunit
LGCGTVIAGENETNTAPQVRVGVYDSRAVAYAHFWSDPHQKKQAESVAAARAAKQSGDTNEFQKYATAFRDEQANMHRQVFSIAPADAAMAAIHERIPEIEKQASVSALVSKWDESALKQYKNAEKVDVTDQLVREFITPTDKQLKTIESIRKAEPLSLEKCDELIRKCEI